MLICNPYEIVIEGITQKGKRFRPSDWAERLCGVLASFDQGHRLSYHQWVRPILVDNIRCVTIDRKLEQISPEMFHFLMDFAHDNDLHILDCKSFLEEHNEQKQIALEDAVRQTQDKPVTSKPPQSSPKTIIPSDTQIRELAPAEIDTAFAALHSIHPNIRDINQFQDLVHIQQAEGYRLLGIFEEGKHNAVAVCGFRICTNFAFGRYMNIDDLVSANPSMQYDYLGQLLTATQEIAQATYCTSIQICTRQQQKLNDLYLDHHFISNGEHFSYVVKTVS
ncbi:DUF3579 domain-containing protein [Neisseriaceae bacterium ESL0693]|nr:DUF3579 domain-containing protein [Neisseriaceae bacterium ESL0693]